jgi:phosphoribosylanthranilate isomerase
LAGGLTSENVAQAIEQVQPYAVDVSGGVELTKGIKDAAKIAAFMRQVYL